MMTLLERIKQHAQQQGGALALVCDDGFMTYAELHKQVSLQAEQLRCHKPSVMALALENGRHWVCAQLAAMAAGVPVVPVPGFFSAQQVEHLMYTTQPDLLLAHPDDKRLSIYCGQAWPEFAPHARWLSDMQSPVLPDDTALITFTSGTTGTPKGVCISEALLMQVVTSLAQVTRALGIERHACLLPLAVMLEHFAGVLVPLYSGALVMVYSAAFMGLSGSAGLNCQVFAEALTRLAPQSLILTPELLRMLLMLVDQGVHLPALKFVAVGGAKVSSALLKTAHSAGLPVYEGYGLSEAGSVVSLNLPGAHKIGSVGQPLPHCQIRISAAGEILVAGVESATYLGNAPTTSNWLATGDLGYLDEQGYLHIKGRCRQVQINSFGRNFSPEWIEAELMRLPGIRQAVIFGDQLPAITAVIDALPGASIQTLAQQLERLNAELPDYARIRHWLLADEPFSVANQELTANGRLRRTQLWQAYGERVLSHYSDLSEHTFLNPKRRNT